MKKKYWNNQKYSECQLVAIWNAAKYLEIPVPKQYGKEYEEDCIKGMCKIGACIKIKHVLDKLNINKIKGHLTKEWILKNFPVIYSVLSPRRGLHAVTAVGMDKDKIILTNYAKNRLYKMTIERLIKINAPLFHEHFYPHKIIKITTEKE